MQFMQRCLLVGATARDLQPVRDLLPQVRQLSVVGEVLELEAVLPAMRRHWPDLAILVPEQLPNHGLDLINRLRTFFPAVKVIVVITRYDVDLFCAYAELGVDGFFFGDNLDELIERLDDIEAGRGGLDSRLAGQFARILGMPTGQAILRAARSIGTVARDVGADNVGHSARIPNSPMDRLRQKGLGAREAEIALMAGRGFQVSRIAEEQRVTRGTVTVTLRRAEVKLGCSNVRELRCLLIREGLA